MALILLIIVVLLIAYILHSSVTEKPPNAPPELPRLPVWGSYWFLLWGDYQFPYKTLAYYVKKYKSKVISLYLGVFYTVVANDYESIKEVLTRKEFDGRLSEAYLFKARTYGKKIGIFSNDDAEWLLHRRFTLRNMRDFGFGRRHEKLEGFIHSQVAILVDTLMNGPTNELEKTIVKDGTAYFPDVLFASAANSIWFVMSGEIHERKDFESLRDLCRSAMLFQRSGDTTGGAILQTPWLRNFGKKGFGFHGIVMGTYAMANFAKRFVEKRRSTTEEDQSADEERRLEGFMDVYLKKMKECEGTSGFTDEQLLILVVDMMFPALSAVPSAITHCIKFMIHRPLVMKKVQREIDDVVGRSRLPEWNDRIKYGQYLVTTKSIIYKEIYNVSLQMMCHFFIPAAQALLPYTEATIRELLRIETATPWSIPHRATEDTTLKGYNIPANAVVVTNLAAMHNDPDLWGDPENFRPERFLTDDGKKMAKDYSLPFGFGRRVCAGETYARFSFFAHFAALAQNFNFDLIDGEPTGLQDVLPGLITTPKDTWIRVLPR